jgi:hypothetical protein
MPVVRMSFVNFIKPWSGDHGVQLMKNAIKHTLLGFVTGALLVIGFNSAEYVISVNVMKPLKSMDVAEVSHD